MTTLDTVESLNLVGANFCELLKFYRFVETLFRVFFLYLQKELVLYNPNVLICGGCQNVKVPTNSMEIEPPQN